MAQGWTPTQAAAAAIEGFGGGLGLNFTFLDAGRVEAKITITPRHLNDAGVVHGGMLMGIADTLGGVGARLSLRPGWTTATTESSTHFLKAAKGPILVAVCQPIHIGRLLSVWMTEIFEQERKVAVVTQTQIHLEPRRAEYRR